MRQRARKRSAAITLVLSGSATLAGCGAPVEQRDVYSNLEYCTRDWANAALCEPVDDSRYDSSYFYSPPYYSEGMMYTLFGRTRYPRIIASPYAYDAFRVRTGTVARSPTAALAMRTGAGPRGRATYSHASSVFRSDASVSRSSGSMSRSGSTSRGGFGSTGRSSVS